KGDTTVVWIVDDGNGQSATCTTVITVEDNEDPTWVNPPADLTVECDGAGNTTDFSDWLDNTFTGTDNCPNWVITNDSTGLSDDCGETGTETVTFTLTDESGNFIELDATFTIVDTTVPTIDTAASNSTVECDGAGNTTELDAWLLSNGGAVASDDCSGVVWSNDFTALSDDC
ncbi:MAG: hypothetical protein GY914_07775, partial [Prochlorococcus sp.]|nr:hypothetical protein [Prochlorococcus sp.]